MLIISRKKDQKIIISDDIEITILEVGRNRVRFGINAPKHVAIHTRLKTSADAHEAAPSLDGSATEEPESQTLPAVAAFSRRR